MARGGMAVVTVALAACVDGPALDREAAYVIGGAATTAGEFPGVGALMYDFGDGSGPQFGCTGTLIAPDVVLTAAHCIDPELWGTTVPGFTLALDVRAAAGVPEIVPGREGIAFDAFDIEAPLEDGLAQFHDIGVLRLAASITTVPPARMVRRSHVPRIVAGLAVEIAGYGLTDPDGAEGGVMFDAQATIASLNASEIQIGAGTPAPQNCNGDSGGPGFAEFGTGRRIIGVVSRSFAGGRCVTGSIDTRVDPYLSWIHAQVPEGLPCGSGLEDPCPGEPDDGEESGWCAAGGGSGGVGSMLMVVLAGAGASRRRRRRGAGT